MQAEVQSVNPGFNGEFIKSHSMSSVSDLHPYPAAFLTNVMFTDYLSSGVLPTTAGHESWGSGWTSASSVVFQTGRIPKFCLP